MKSKKNKIVAKNTRSKSNLKTGRNYDYDKTYQSSPKQVKNRVARNKARQKALKEGRVKKYGSKDIGHIKSLKSGGSRSVKNTRVESAKKNRAKK